MSSPGPITDVVGLKKNIALHDTDGVPFQDTCLRPTRIGRLKMYEFHGFSLFLEVILKAPPKQQSVRNFKSFVASYPKTFFSKSRITLSPCQSAPFIWRGPVCLFLPKKPRNSSNRSLTKPSDPSTSPSEK